MKDYFNLYGDGQESKLRDLIKKGEENYTEDEKQKVEQENKELKDEIPLSFSELEQPDIEINQEAFDEKQEEEVQVKKPIQPAQFITVDEIKQDTFKSEVEKPQPVMVNTQPEPVDEPQPEPKSEEPKAEEKEDDFLFPLPQEREPIIEEETEEVFDDSNVNMKVVKKAQKKAMKKAAKKKKRIKNLIWFLCVVIISVVLALFAIKVGRDVLGITTNEEQRKSHSFSIEQGSSSDKIIETLEENNIIEFPMVFKLYCKLKHADGTFKFGRYTMYETYNYDTVISMLQSDGAQRETVTITIPECATLDDISAILVKNNVCTAEQFESVITSDVFDADFPFLRNIPDTVYRRYEGYLYPNTYEVFCVNETYSVEEYGKSNAQLAVEKMLQSFSDNLPDDYEQKIKSLQKYGINSLNDVLSIASIVDLECNGEYDQMSSVAAIFMNRLVWDSEPHFLGSTPTYYYPDNRYNTNAGPMTVVDDNGNSQTYKAGFEGLPPGAQCAPVKQAIDAVLNPNKDYLAKGYYFFVTDTDKNYYYNQTLAQHNNTIDELINKGKWDA